MSIIQASTGGKQAMSKQALVLRKLAELLEDDREGGYLPASIDPIITAMEKAATTISQQAIRIEELEMAFGEACVFIGRVSAEALQDNYSYLDQMKGQLKLGFTASGEPIVQSPSLSTEKK